MPKLAALLLHAVDRCSEKDDPTDGAHDRGNRRRGIRGGRGGSRRGPATAATGSDRTRGAVSRVPSAIRAGRHARVPVRCCGGRAQLSGWCAAIGNDNSDRSSAFSTVPIAAPVDAFCTSGAELVAQSGANGIRWCSGARIIGSQTFEA